MTINVDTRHRRKYTYKFTYLDEDIRAALSPGYRLTKLVVVPRYRYSDDYSARDIALIRGHIALRISVPRLCIYLLAVYNLYTRRASAQKTSPCNRARLCNLSRKCRCNWFNLLQVPNGASADPCAHSARMLQDKDLRLSGCPSSEDACPSTIRLRDGTIVSPGGQVAASWCDTWRAMWRGL